MRGYVIDADLTEDEYIQIEPHIVGTVMDEGWIEYNGACWEPRECKMNDAHWDDGQCTWGCICSACGAKFEHHHSSDFNHCPNCGARRVDE